MRRVNWDMEMDRAGLELLFEYSVGNKQLELNQGIRNKFLLAINMMRHDRPDDDAMRFMNEVVAAAIKSAGTMTPGLELVNLVGILKEVASCHVNYQVVSFNTDETAHWSSLHVLLRKVGDVLSQADYRDVSRPYVDFLRTTGTILAAV